MVLGFWDRKAAEIKNFFPKTHSRITLDFAYGSRREGKKDYLNPCDVPLPNLEKMNNLLSSPDVLPLLKSCESDIWIVFTIYVWKWWKLPAFLFIFPSLYFSLYVCLIHLFLLHSLCMPKPYFSLERVIGFSLF